MSTKLNQDDLDALIKGLNDSSGLDLLGSMKSSGPIPQAAAGKDDRDLSGKTIPMEVETVWESLPGDKQRAKMDDTNESMGDDETEEDTLPAFAFEESMAIPGAESEVEPDDAPDGGFLPMDVISSLETELEPPKMFTDLDAPPPALSLGSLEGEDEDVSEDDENGFMGPPALPDTLAEAPDEPDFSAASDEVLDENEIAALLGQVSGLDEMAAPAIHAGEFHGASPDKDVDEDDEIDTDIFLKTEPPLGSALAEEDAEEDSGPETDHDEDTALEFAPPPNSLPEDFDVSMDDSAGESEDLDSMSDGDEDVDLSVLEDAQSLLASLNLPDDEADSVGDAAEMDGDQPLEAAEVSEDSLDQMADSLPVEESAETAEMMLAIEPCEPEAESDQDDESLSATDIDNTGSIGTQVFHEQDEPAEIPVCVSGKPPVEVVSTVRGHAIEACEFPTLQAAITALRKFKGYLNEGLEKHLDPMVTSFNDEITLKDWSVLIKSEKEIGLEPRDEKGSREDHYDRAFKMKAIGTASGGCLETFFYSFSDTGSSPMVREDSEFSAILRHLAGNAAERQSSDSVHKSTHQKGYFTPSNRTYEYKIIVLENIIEASYLSVFIDECFEDGEITRQMKHTEYCFFKLKVART